MDKCEVCGNDYKNLFSVKLKNDDQTHWFDSFECASHRLAPSCAHCEVKVLGHGIEAGEQTFCCAHCARQAGFTEAVDRVA